MFKKNQWFWESYFLFYTILTLINAYEFFSPKSEVSFYYYFLCSFNLIFLFNYLLNVLQIIFNVIHCFPFGFYTFNINILRPKFWQYLFVLRIIFDVMGHTYEKHFFISLYHSTPKIALMLLAKGILFSIPSYIACYRYAFRKANNV